MKTAHDKLHQRQLLRMQDAKTGEADDVAGLVSYLASPKAQHVTGAFDKPGTSRTMLLIPQ
jgi:NAD(P)-dependent dehydrogenase (short-subunit alcohol dehydrogenase family)